MDSSIGKDIGMTSLVPSHNAWMDHHELQLTKQMSHKEIIRTVSH